MVGACNLEHWSVGVLGTFFRCVFRVTRCELCTAEFRLQYFNPQPGTRNSKRFIIFNLIIGKVIRYGGRKIRNFFPKRIAAS
jgi:hypothetical protein